MAVGEQARARREVGALRSDIAPCRPGGTAGRQGPSRVAELLPIRYGRMVSSPFAFYRGAALVMAADLATTPSSVFGCSCAGMRTCPTSGSILAGAASGVRPNDFDETLPGPFEWDVKRLAASIEIAARSQSFRSKECRAVVVGAVRSYRESMRAFARMPNQAVWYARLDADEFLGRLREVAPPERTRKAETLIASAKTKDSMQAFRKLTHEVDGHRGSSPIRP